MGKCTGLEQQVVTEQSCCGALAMQKVLLMHGRAHVQIGKDLEGLSPIDVFACCSRQEHAREGSKDW